MVRKYRIIKDLSGEIENKFRLLEYYFWTFWELYNCIFPGIWISKGHYIFVDIFLSDALQTCDSQGNQYDQDFHYTNCPKRLQLMATTKSLQSFIPNLEC